MPKKEKKEDKVLEEIKRHNKVLMEHMEKQVETVAEQHSSVMKKLEEHDGQFVQIDQRFNSVEMAVMENSRQIKGLKTGQEALKTDVQGLKTDFQGLKAGQETLKTDFQGLKAGQETLKTDFQGLKTGQQRIEHKLDTTLADHEQRIKRVEEKVGA